MFGIDLCLFGPKFSRESGGVFFCPTSSPALAERPSAAVSPDGLRNLRCQDGNCGWTPAAWEGIPLFATAADSLLHAALVTAALLALPILAVALVVGVVIGLLQALTQIQEMTLTFLPKLLAIALLFVVAGPWWLQTLTTFASVAWQQAGLLRP